MVKKDPDRKDYRAADEPQDEGTTPDAPEAGSWTRSFPRGTIEGEDWMVDVLDDLHAYASTHNLDEIADTLSETRKMVIAHLQATRH